MFGFLRLLLALLVASSHITGPISLNFLSPLTPDFNQGSFAVIGFYILSGFLMAAILKTKFKIGRKILTKLFFKDRFLRIFPLYYFYLLLTIIFLVTTKSFIFAVPGLFAHLTIIPLNYYQLFRFSLETHTINPLITPAWSLGSELQFYLLIPFIVNRPRIKLLFFISSLSVFIFSSLFVSEPFFLNYIFPAGTLFAFLTGSYLCNFHMEKKYGSAAIISLTWIILTIIFFYTFITGKTAAGVNAELFLGFIILVPIIFILSKYKDHPLSKNLGNLAYPIFLSHSLADRIATGQTNAYLLTLILSLVGYKLIETPLTKLRHQLFTNILKQTH